MQTGAGTSVIGSVRVWQGQEEDEPPWRRRQDGEVGGEGFFFRDKEEIGRRKRRCSRHRGSVFRRMQAWPSRTLDSRESGDSDGASRCH